MHTLPKVCHLATGLLLCVLTYSTHGGDWPQFLGPNRNGVASGETIRINWKSQPPSKVWEKEVGSGFSSPVVANGNIYLYHRLRNKNALDRMELSTGKQIWRYQHDTRYRDDFGFDNGPRATPCVEGDSVFLMSADGFLTAVNQETGKQIWQIDAKSKWNSGKGFFGMAPSPLVIKNLVVYVIGGQDNSGVVALDRKTGETVWTATEDEAGYASPVLEETGATSNLWIWSREKLYALQPASGNILASLRWRSSMNASVNAATPLVIQEGIFISASYGTGSALVSRQGTSLKRVWSGDDQISNHYATCVYHKGYLYGFHGRQEYGPEFRCIEAATGKVQWSKDNLGAGTVTCINDQLLLMMESGELILINASQHSFQTIGRRQILPSGVRAFPAVADGRLLARSPERLVCYELGE